MKLVEVHTKADQQTDGYYLGYLVYQNDAVTVLIALDDDANASGVMVLNNDDLLGVVEESPSIAYVQRLIDEGQSRDPFDLMPRNQQLLKRPFSQLYQAAEAALLEDMPLTITLNNGVVYGGIVIQSTLSEIRIRQINDDYSLDRLYLAVPTKQISSLEINAASGKLWQEWYAARKSEPAFDYGLCELYLDWVDDDRFGGCLLGHVIAQNDHYLLLESVSNYGQLESICLVNRADIVHETDASPAISYTNYLIKRNQEQGLFDPNNFSKLAKSLHHIPTTREVILTAGKHLVNIDDYEFDGENLGYVTHTDEYGFTIKDALTGEETDHPYHNVCTIDLASVELEKMHEYLAAQKG